MLMRTSAITRRQLLAAAAAAPLLEAAQRPNIVFLYSDDHHYQCLGAAGNPHIRTPNLDRLAGRGVYFTNGIISTAQCCPSRGIFLSGQETFQSGLLSNGATRFREGQGPTVVEQLRRGGYETALVGKWHVTPTPAECGFTHAPLWLRGGASEYRNPRLRRGLDGTDEVVDGHITDLLSDAAIGYLKGARRPFLLWLAYNAPHTPWYADGKYRSHYEGKDPRAIAPPGHPPGGRDFDWITYYSVITHLDEGVGRVVGALDQAGLWKNTVVFFIGDNGFMCGTKGLSGKVVPWEESIRVPFLAAGGAVKRGVRSDAAVASVDVPATWMELAGVEPVYRLTGRSLRDCLRKGKGNPEVAFSTWVDGRPEALAVRQRVEPYRLARGKRYKYVLWESRKQALYDWQADPGEESNLIDNPHQDAVVKELRSKLMARMEETNDPARSWIS